MGILDIAIIMRYVALSLTRLPVYQLPIYLRISMLLCLLVKEPVCKLTSW